MKRTIACLLMFVLLFQISVMAQTKFEIKKAWVEHNVFNGGNEGMNICLDFSAHNFGSSDISSDKVIL